MWQQHDDSGWLYIDIIETRLMMLETKHYQYDMAFCTSYKIYEHIIDRLTLAVDRTVIFGLYSMTIHMS